jgi:hypothetical protein
MSDEKRHAAEEAHQSPPVPKFLLLAYAVIGSVWLYYMIVGLKFGSNSPTGF